MIGVGRFYCQKMKRFITSAAMKKLKRGALAVMLLPACYGVSSALWNLIKPFKDVPEGSFYFFCGVASYFAFQWVFFAPMRTYVFGHELTHALAAWTTGGKVRHFHVSKKGGSVTVTKSNFFVALAPYMVPLYALLILGVFFVASLFYSVRPYWNWFLWLLGVSFGFHAALTAFALQQDQPDLKASGKFLSGVIIFLGNTLSLVFLLGAMFPRTVSWERFVRQSGQETVYAVRQVSLGGQYLWSAAKAKADAHLRQGSGGQADRSLGEGAWNGAVRGSLVRN
jgi:hypothetical protein